MHFNVGVCILTGGASSRMGQPKADLMIRSAEYGEETFLSRMIRELSFCPTRFLSVNSSQNYSVQGYTAVRDCYEGIGPMGGIYSVLEYAGLNKMCDAVLFVPCDMPMFTQEDARILIDAYAGEDVLFTVNDGREQPLCAIYSVNCLPIIRKLIDEENYRLRDIISAANAKGTDSIQASHLVNVNNKEEYDRIMML